MYLDTLIRRSKVHIHDKKNLSFLIYFLKFFTESELVHISDLFLPVQKTNANTPLKLYTYAYCMSICASFSKKNVFLNFSYIILNPTEIFLQYMYHSLNIHKNGIWTGTYFCDLFFGNWFGVVIRYAHFKQVIQSH